MAIEILPVHNIDMWLYDNIILVFIVRTSSQVFSSRIRYGSLVDRFHWSSRYCKYDIVLECNRRECGKLLLDLVIKQQQITGKFSIIVIPIDSN